MKWLLMLPVLAYRLLLGWWMPRVCRFRPTCSAYALEALAVHGAVRGSWLTVRRLCRCHPFTEPDFDPVPPKGGPFTAPSARAPATDRSPPC